MQIFKYESSRKIRSSLIMAGIFSILAVVYTSFFPSVKEMGDDLLEAMPPAMIELLNLESFGTIEGFLATEMYAIFWVVLLGIYFAYVAADSIAGDIQKGKMDLTLSCAVSRRQVILERTSSLVVPLLALNIMVPVVIYLMVLGLGEAMDPLVLIMVHLLSIPYLMVCISMGLMTSVVFQQPKAAGGVAAGSVAVLWLIEGMARMVSAFDWLARLTPTHYYNPTEILVHGTFNYGGALLLMAISIILFIVAMEIFHHRDI